MKYLKNLGFKKTMRFFISILMVCAEAAPVFAQAQSETPVFDNLKEAFEEGEIFSAFFTHEYNDSFTGEQQYSEGKIWIGRDRYKIEGSSQQMLIDGDMSTVYDGAKNRVIMSEYIEEEDDFAPSRMLQGADSTYRVTEVSIPGSGTRVYLESEDLFSVFREIQIYINESGIPFALRPLTKPITSL